LDVLIAAAALLVAAATSVSTIATAGGVTVPAATTAGSLMVNSSAATNIDIVSLTTVQNKISQAGVESVSDTIIKKYLIWLSYYS
jgi:hypothetical protein